MGVGVGVGVGVGAGTDVGVGTWYMVQDTRYKNASQDRKKIIGILLYFYL